MTKIAFSSVVLAMETSLKRGDIPWVFNNLHCRASMRVFLRLPIQPSIKRKNLNQSRCIHYWIITEKFIFSFWLAGVARTRWQFVFTAKRKTFLQTYSLEWVLKCLRHCLKLCTFESKFSIAERLKIWSRSL